MLGAILAQAGNAPQVIKHPPFLFKTISPELILIATAILLMVADALGALRQQESMAGISLAGIVLAAAASVFLWHWPGDPTALGGMVAVDRYAVFFRLVILAVAALSVLLSYQYLRDANEARGEYYPLLLFATSGMTLIAAASDLIVVFLALEILSLSLYLLTGFSFRRIASAEGAMKYFLLGAFSSAFFLYGVAMAYGATGSTNLSAIAERLTGTPGTAALALAAAGLLAVGFAFKVAAVPFHMWTPDAYQGAPTCVTAFMSAGTKVAAFAAFFRVFETALSPMRWDWRPFIWVLAALSMVVGSVLAIAQSDIKRMLAYSSIVHGGFILVGLTAANHQGLQGAMYYLAVYPAMILGAFGVAMLVSARGERLTSLGSYAGLARRNPFAGAALAVCLLSLAGIPPTAGFTAKVAVFSAAVQSGHWPLVLIAVLASVVAAFYYIRVIVLMYMEEPPPELAAEAEAVAVAGSRGAAVGRVAVALPTLSVLVLGVFPGILFGLLKTASVIRF